MSAQWHCPLQMKISGNRSILDLAGSFFGCVRVFQSYRSRPVSLLSQKTENAVDHGVVGREDE